MELRFRIVELGIADWCGDIVELNWVLPSVMELNFLKIGLLTFYFGFARSELNFKFASVEFFIFEILGSVFCAFIFGLELIIDLKREMEMESGMGFNEGDETKGSLWFLEQKLDQTMDDEAGRLRNMYREKKLFLQGRFIFGPDLR